MSWNFVGAVIDELDIDISSVQIIFKITTILEDIDTQHISFEFSVQNLTFLL